MNIVITAPFAPEQLRLLEQNHAVQYLPQQEGVALRTENALNALLRESAAQVFICESDAVTENVLAGLDQLKLICVCRAGLNNIDIPACTKRRIAVTNTAGRNAGAVADMAVALFVSAARFLSAGERALREGRWDNDLYYRMRGIELADHVAAFIGFGAVPRQLAKRLAAFDMKLIAYDPFVSADEMAALGVRKVDLETAFAEGDFVSNHLPTTPETKGLIGEALIGRMKRTAYFINTARASTVSDAAILDALRHHRIAGGAFDVFNEEPLPLDSPFLALDNVVLTPHLGGASLEVVKNHSRMVYEDVSLFAAGKRPVRLANAEALR